MAGPSPSEAVWNYLSPIQQALSCLTDARVTVSPRGYEMLTDSEGHALVFNQGVPILLPGGSGVTLDIKQRYRIVTATGDRGPYKVSIVSYMYTIANQDDQEIIGYHWHPDGHHFPWPHIHIKHGIGERRPEFEKAHVPTGRVAIEDVVRLLILGFGVPSKRENWEEILDECQGRFEQWRTWGGSSKVKVQSAQ